MFLNLIKKSVSAINEKINNFNRFKLLFAFVVFALLNCAFVIDMPLLNGIILYATLLLVVAFAVVIFRKPNENEKNVISKINEFI